MAEQVGQLLGDLLALLALLGLQDEAAALVEIDATVAECAVAVGLLDRALKDVVVEVGRRHGRCRARHLQNVAQLRQKQGVVRPLLAALAVAPTRDEVLDRAPTPWASPPGFFF